jgi:nucleotide-binding universal stress UspA family protein
MKVSHILCPIDFSRSSPTVLDFASRLAQDTGATLHIAFVEEDPAPYGIGLYGQLPLPISADGQRLSQLRPSVQGIKFEHHLLLGDAAGQIVQFAGENNIDLIVMGTHGRSGMMRLLMGSVAEEVLRRTACPVLTIKEPGAAHTGTWPASVGVVEQANGE